MINNGTSLLKLFRVSVFCGVVACGQVSWGLNYSSEIFEMKSDFQKKLFELEVKSVTGTDDIVTATGVFKDTSGQVVIQDVAKYKDAELIESQIEQKQTGEKGLIQVKADEIHFSYTSAEGKQKTNTEKIKKGMKVLAPANFIVFIQKYWTELHKEKTIPLRLAIWDRQETVGFDLILEGPEKKSGKDLVKIKLKTSSFIISALVDPLHMWFSADGKQLVEMRGRVAPKIKSGTKWKTLDADVKYYY